MTQETSHATNARILAETHFDRTYARAMLTDGVLNCSIMYCESMPCLI